MKDQKKVLKAAQKKAGRNVEDEEADEADAEGDYEANTVGREDVASLRAKAI